MKKMRSLTVYKYVNLIGFALCLLTMCLSLLSMEKQLPNDTFYISPVLSNSGSLFNIDDVTYIDDNKDKAVISYEKIDNADIDYNYNSMKVRAVYTDSDYFNIIHHEFIAGGPFTEKYDRDKVVVLPDKTAYYFFGSYDCIGKAIRIDNVLHEITGIVKTPADQKEHFVLLNYKSRLSNENDITNLYIKDENYSKTGTQLKARSYLDFIENNSADYHMTDLNQYVDNNYIKCALMLMVLSVYFITFILVKIIKSIGSKISDYKGFIICLASLVCLSGILKAIYDILTRLIWVTSERFTVKSVIRHVFNINAFPSNKYLPYQIEGIKNADSLINTVFCVGMILFVNFIALSYIDRVDKYNF